MTELVYIVKWPPRGTQAGDVVVHSSALETATSRSKSFHFPDMGPLRKSSHKDSSVNHSELSYINLRL